VPVVCATSLAYSSEPATSRTVKVNDGYAGADFHAPTDRITVLQAGAGVEASAEH